MEGESKKGTTTIGTEHAGKQSEHPLQAMTTAVKRACDACHRRKVKCDGINPCRNCAASQLSCTYNAIPQKKGPKGSRAKVISELRETQRQTSLSAKVQRQITGIGNSPPSPTLAPTPGLMTPDMVKDCVEFYFANMYPMMPILQRQRLEQQVMYMDTSLDTYCLLTALCSFMMLQPGMSIPGGDPYGLDSMPGANIVSATLLMEETLRVRKAYDYLDQPSFNSLCTSYILFCCYYGLDMHDKAWFHLREATTLVHMTGMNKEEAYMQCDGVEASRRRRLFWLLFVTERAYALQRQRPLSLQATVNPPTLNDDPTDPLAHQLNSFLARVNLFRVYDDAFVALWNKTRFECTQNYLTTLQKQIQDVLPPYLSDPQAQISETLQNQQWLKNMSWQLSMANGNCGENGMSFQYPINITRDLLPMVSHFPSNLGLLGLGLVEKLYGVTFSLNEYLSMQPGPRDPFTVGPRTQLHQILNVITVLRNGDYRFLPLLLSKVHDVLPRIINPMLQNAPENANACNVDIFDGFGNAGMAQPAVYPTEEYDNKFAVPRIEELSNDSGSNSGSATSNNDMNTPFVSSPAMMSPPNPEISNGLPNNFSSINDMVISPMTRTPGSSFSNQGATNNSQAQHQHNAMSQYQQMNPPMQNMNSNINATANTTFPSPNAGFGQGISSATIGNGVPMSGSSMMGRQPPQLQRTNSFALNSQIRTVGDFHAVQRASSDLGGMSSMGMVSMGDQMDFNTIPR